MVPVLNLLRCYWQLRRHKTTCSVLFFTLNAIPSASVAWSIEVFFYLVLSLFISLCPITSSSFLPSFRYKHGVPVRANCIKYGLVLLMLAVWRQKFVSTITKTSTSLKTGATACNNNNYLFTAIGLSPGGSGYFTCIQNMKLVTTKFKSGGLHKKHVVATWNVGNHLSICL